MHARQFNSLNITITLVFAFAFLFLSSQFVRADEHSDHQTRYIFALGDSLTAGYGLDAGLSFPDQLEAALQQDGYNVEVVNGGVSGDTSKGGRNRLAWALSGDPAAKADIAIVALGANDALRGLDPAKTREKLAAIIEYLQGRNMQVLLAGMLAPPNMGPDYAAEFDPIYGDLAAKYGVTLYPFFLDGVATIPELNLDDGMHPNSDGISIMVTRIAPMVKTLLTD